MKAHQLADRIRGHLQRDPAYTILSGDVLHEVTCPASNLAVFLADKVDAWPKPGGTGYGKVRGRWRYKVVVTAEYVPADDD